MRDGEGSCGTNHSPAAQYLLLKSKEILKRNDFVIVMSLANSVLWPLRFVLLTKSNHILLLAFHLPDIYIMEGRMIFGITFE